MRRWRWWGSVGLVLAVGGALLPPAALGAGLSGTAHDFSGQSATTTLCNTCHVPHRTGSATLLWNHTLSSQTLTFGTGAATSSGTTLPTNVGAWSGTTKYCLSCHDGSVAVGNLIVGTDWSTTYFLEGNMVIAPGGSLSGNHPVAIPYPDQAGATYNAITTAANPSDYQASPTGVKIYGTTAGQKGIECASCHDIHKDATAFLRVPLSSLCTSCHIK